MDVLLHVGHEHPDALWIGVSTVLTFLLGIGVGAYALDRRSAGDETGDVGGATDVDPDDR